MVHAGFTIAPYHDHVPSFGEWGWHLAWLDHTSSDTVKEQVRANPQLNHIETSYITSDVLKPLSFLVRAIKLIMKP